MAWRRLKTFDTFLKFNKTEQKGIVILLIIIALLIGLRFLYPFLNNEIHTITEKDKKEMEAFLAKQTRIDDSINIARLKNKTKTKKETPKQKLNPFRFNPNNLSEEKWIEMGFTKGQVRTIMNYKAKGGQFRSKADVKKMYTISNAEYKIIEPYIYIPEKAAENNNKSTKRNYKKAYKVTNISTADSAQLVDNLFIIPAIAARTVAYRNLLGGFHKPEQIKEVYGMTESYFARIEPYLTANSSGINKIHINNVTFSELLSHPYFDYKTTQSIINTRNKKNGFRNYHEISATVNDSVYNRIKPYVVIKDTEYYE